MSKSPIEKLLNKYRHRMELTRTIGNIIGGVGTLIILYMKFIGKF